MAGEPKLVDDLPVGRLFLSLDNPRHEPLDSEPKVIEYLCDKEEVYPLARDIARHGLNPLERFALYPNAQSGGKKGVESYVAAEGNRRLCALKLLNDPELAPARVRASFVVLAETGIVPKTISAVVFPDADSVKLWLERIHSGAQGGIGRKEWTSEQKTRFHGDNKNKPAQVLLDYAQNAGYITKDQRERKITTVQRFIGNDVFRETLGLDQSDEEEFRRSRSKGEFDTILKQFMKDLIDKQNVNSRMNKGAIIQYARTLGSLPGITSARIEPEALTPEIEGPKPPSSRRSPPRKPTKTKNIRHEAQIEKQLKILGNQKLESLYYSICSLDLEPHAPLIGIGVWSFFESLTACAGRNSNTSFDGFLSKAKRASYGINDKSLQAPIENIRDYGNTTKHHPVAAIFNGEQMNNDMVALRDLIVKCIEEAISKNLADPSAAE